MWVRGDSVCPVAWWEEDCTPDNPPRKWWVKWRRENAQTNIVAVMALSEAEAVRVAHEVLDHDPAWQLVSATPISAQT